MEHPSGNEQSNSSTLCTCVNNTCQSFGRTSCLYNTTQLILVVVVTASLSAFTILGNILVMLSIKVNRQLRTVNNYFLFSLACADLITGLFSMNLYTLYMIRGYWPLGTVMCDLWLALDYVVGNASVMNLLVISFDRYFCITQPLSYPARRTAKLASLMIAGAWLFPLLLWAPAILFWESLTGKRIVPDQECYIQLLSSPAITLGTTLPSFYLPAAIMIGLYTRISLASHNRLKGSRLVCQAPRSTNFSINHFLLRRRNWVATEQETKTSTDTPRESLEAETSCDTKQRYDLKPPRELINSFEPADGVLTSPTPFPGQTHKILEPLSKTSRPCAVTRNSLKDNYGSISQSQNNGSNHTQQLKTTLTSLKSLSSLSKNQDRSKHRLIARERKVTKTILAILLAFIVTWTPYNVMAVVGTFCHFCIPDTIWIVGYWLCYINSTINPGCYAMCNVTFRKTFRKLLWGHCSNMSRKG